MRPPEVVVVTGGSAGVGRAVALAFARRGDWVAILARDPARVEAACAELRAAGATVLGIPLDVADAQAVEAAAERIERELGRITIWVNNAMATVFAPAHEMSAEEFRRVTEVTYLGVVHGTLAALKRMRPRNAGCILQVGSALAYRSIPLQSAYCAAKAAVRGFTDALRCELIHDGSKLQLTMVQLSAFNTPQFDWGRNRLPRRVQPVPPIFQPELAAQAIVWAATHSRREVWLGWPAVRAIVAARWLPGALGDRVAARTAYEGQMTAEAVPDFRTDNLEVPLAGPFGTHGRFDARARAGRWQWSPAKRRWPVAAALGALAGVLAAVLA